MYSISTSGITVCLYISVFRALFLSLCNALGMVSVQTASVQENSNIYNRSPESTVENIFFLYIFQMCD